MTFAALGCVEDEQTPELTVVQARAEQFLTLLRSEQWSEAARFIADGPVTQRRLSIPDDAPPGVRIRQKADWLEELYRNVKPGPIFSIELDSDDPDLARVTYRAGDLDVFSMRFIDSEWMYTLD